MTDAHVGLVGPDADGAAAVVGNAGGHAHVGTAADVLAADLDAVVALSESALYDLVRAGLPTNTPALAVNAGDGIPSDPASDRDRALRRLVRGEYTTHERPTLAVDARREEYRALADVALVTAEAARISEYAIDATGETGDVHVDTVRADGVVVATPAGTRGYVRTDDAPVLSPTVEAVAVVPIAPFRVECPDWVVSLPATLSVERDETKVALLVDDEDVGLVEPGSPVDIAYGDPVTLAHTHERR